MEKLRSPLITGPSSKSSDSPSRQPTTGIGNTPWSPRRPSAWSCRLAWWHVWFPSAAANTKLKILLEDNPILLYNVLAFARAISGFFRGDGVTAGAAFGTVLIQGFDSQAVFWTIFTQTARICSAQSSADKKIAVEPAHAPDHTGAISRTKAITNRKCGK